MVAVLFGPCERGLRADARRLEIAEQVCDASLFDRESPPPARNRLPHQCAEALQCGAHARFIPAHIDGGFDPHERDLAPEFLVGQGFAEHFEFVERRGAQVMIARTTADAIAFDEQIGAKPRLRAQGQGALDVRGRFIQRRNRERAAGGGEVAVRSRFVIPTQLVMATDFGCTFGRALRVQRLEGAGDAPVPIRCALRRRPVATVSQMTWWTNA